MSLCKSEINITWIVENYLLIGFSEGFHIQSPFFSFPDRRASGILINLDPRGLYDLDDAYLSLELVPFCYPRDLNQIINSKVQLCNADNETIEGQWGTEDENNFLYPKVLKTEELEHKLKKSSSDTLIVRCSIPNLNTKSETNVTVIAKTIIDFDKFSFQWLLDIHDCSEWLTKEETIRINNSKFKITVTAPEDDVLIEIKLCQPKYQMQKFKCLISFIEKNKEILSSCDFFYFDHRKPEQNPWHFPSFLKKSFLLSKENDCYLKFSFFVSNGMYVEKYIEKVENHQHNSIIPAMDSLKDDLRVMLTSNKFSDVKLRVDGEVICAHKNILASRSPVFSTMFDQDMNENQKGEIDIIDIKADIMKLFLKFLYTGMLDESDSYNLLDLLLASEKYHVSSLKEECCHFLKAQMNHDNICDVVSVADMVGHEVLKNDAINYIKKHAADILGSPKWPQWIKKNPELGSEILCKFSDIIKNAS